MREAIPQKGEVMRYFMLCIGLAALLLGCDNRANAPQEPQEASGNNVLTWHDDDRQVTCWIYSAGYQGGISCLPDSQLGGAITNEPLIGP
jgi:hypothetical protein